MYQSIQDARGDMITHIGHVSWTMNDQVQAKVRYSSAKPLLLKTKKLLIYFGYYWTSLASPMASSVPRSGIR